MFKGLNSTEEGHLMEMADTMQTEGVDIQCTEPSMFSYAEVVSTVDDVVNHVCDNILENDSDGINKRSTGVVYEDGEVSFVMPKGNDVGITECNHGKMASLDLSPKKCIKDAESDQQTASKEFEKPHHFTALKENILQAQCGLVKRQKARKSFPSSGLRSKVEAAQEMKMRIHQSLHVSSVREMEFNNSSENVHSKLHLKELENIVDLSLDLEHFKTVGLKGFESGFMDEKMFQRPQQSITSGPLVKRKRRFGVYSLQNQSRKRKLNKKLRELARQQQKVESREKNDINETESSLLSKVPLQVVDTVTTEKDTPGSQSGKDNQDACQPEEETAKEPNKEIEVLVSYLC